MSKLTRLFIDARRRTSKRWPKRSPISACATRKEREEQFVPSCASCTNRYYGASIRRSTRSRLNPRGVRADLHDDLRLPTRFVMLDKAIATLGSVGVELYPDFTSSRSRSRTRAI